MGCRPDHSITHETHHKGQIVAMLRQLSHIPKIQI
ncbi:DinB family protein [Rummeliibacillus sp. JY-2-4R]